MKLILIKSVFNDVIVAKRKEGMSDEEYKQFYEENKDVALRAIIVANHEQLGRIVEVMKTSLGK